MYVQTPTLQAWSRKNSSVRWFSPQGNFSWGWADFTTKEKLLEANVLSDGALTIVCHVKCLMQSARKARVVLKSPLHGMEREDSSPSTLGTLLQADKESCDVTIVCPAADQPVFDWARSSRKSRKKARRNRSAKDFLETQEEKESGETQADREFRCHKFVLTTRSDVFSAMFRQDMAEAKTSTVRIDDMDADTMSLFLDFLYRDKLPPNLKLAEQLFPLLAAAEKYNIKELMDCAQVRICGLVNANNVAKILAVAEKHNGQKVKDFLVTFLADERRSAAAGCSWCKDASSEFVKSVLTAKEKKTCR